jgi:hypothetical protein
MTRLFRRVEVGADLVHHAQWKRRLCFAEHFHSLRQDLEPRLGLLALLDGPVYHQHGLSLDGGHALEKLRVPLLEGSDLDHSETVPKL